MKITRQQTLWPVLVLSLFACGVQKYELRGNSLAPAADAHITAKINKRQNVTKLEIDATNLTPPDRLVENGSAFVVWTRADSKAAWSRSGALALNDEGRAGRAELTVPEEAFDLAISAEDGANVATPSGKTIFERRVQDE